MKKAITIYTTPGCSQCVMTKNWWRKKGVEYREVDLTTSPDDFEAVKALGYMQAPVVVVNDDGDTENEKHWYGFRPDLLEEFTLAAVAA